MKKNKKFIFLWLIIFIIILTVVFFYHTKNSKKIYLVFNDYGAFKYEDDEWAVFDKEENTIFDHPFKVYINGEDKGDYEIRFFNGKWYYFDEDMDSMNFSGNLFAYNSKQKISLAQVNKNKLNRDDINYLNKVLKKKNLQVENIDNYKINEKVTFDIDQDEKEETIYAVSNADVMQEVENPFSCLFYVKNSKIYILKLDVYTENDDYYLYTINNLFEVGDNGKYYLSIIQFSDMTNENNGMLLYQLNRNGKYELTISSNEKTKDRTRNNDNSIYIGVLLFVIMLVGIYFFYRKMTKEEID